MRKRLESLFRGVIRDGGTSDILGFQQAVMTAPDRDEWPRGSFVTQIRGQEDDSDDPVDVMIYDDIGRDFFGDGITAQEVVAELAELKGRDINVRINSVGGIVFEATAILEALRDHDGDVTSQIDGIAASAATIIAMAGNPIVAKPTSIFLIHNPWSFAAGTADDLERAAADLRTATDIIVDLYVERTSAAEKDVRTWMNEDQFWSAKVAKANGFVDEIAGKGTEPSARGDRISRGLAALRRRVA